MQPGSGPERQALVDRFRGHWHADLSDAADLLRLRRNVFAVAVALAFLATVSITLADTAASPQSRATQFAGLATEVVMAVAILMRGTTMGDLGFSALLYAGLLMGQVGIAEHSQTGVIARTGMLSVTNVILAAIFLMKWRWLAVHLTVAIALLVVQGLQADDRTDLVVDLSTTVSGLLTVALAVRLLRDLAIRTVTEARRGELTDPLTGLLNRRGMERSVGEYWRDHARLRVPVLALVVDVDHFKAINDTQGHAGGDDILRRLAALLGASVRGHDLAVRLGGEEFLVLCEAHPEDGEQIAERLRATVERELAPVTVSIGVHEVLPRAEDLLPEAAWTAVRRADDALYVAKRAGRNRVAFA